MVESAIVLSTLLMILLSSLDLTLAVLAADNLTDTAQQVSRAAVVRGENSSQLLTVWGPATVSGTANDPTEVAACAAAHLIHAKKDRVQIVVEWPDAACREGDRVRTRLTYNHPLITPQLLGISSLTLTAVSTMRIVN